MNWNCPRCQNELGELNGCCEYCKVEGVIVYNPDKYFIREIRIYHISQGGKTVTPQEELFSQLFNHEKILVKDMDMLSLRAHREELAKIAFEARARLTAADDEENDRKKKRSEGTKGFERSVNTDETTTNAINKIKERQKKLSGKEKIREGLVALYSKGMTRLEAEKAADAAMGAGAILARIKDEKSKDIIKDTENIVRSPLSGNEGFTMTKPVDDSAKQKMFNPFDKKG